MDHQADVLEVLPFDDIDDVGDVGVEIDILAHEVAARRMVCKPSTALPAERARDWPPSSTSSAGDPLNFCRCSVSCTTCAPCRSVIGAVGEIQNDSGLSQGLAGHFGGGSHTEPVCGRSLRIDGIAFGG